MTQPEASGVKREVIGTTSPGSPLSPAVRFGNLLFVSGQTAADADGLEAQAHAVLRKLAAVLQAGGADLSDVVRCGVYLSDIRLRDRMNEVYSLYFREQPPARTTIECKMADAAVLVEIDCIAAILTLPPAGPSSR
jgi:2-iminobutanoate/2-iminopropanoate deaminase